MEEVLNLIPGKMFEFTQELPSSVQERAKVAAASTPAAGGGGGGAGGAAGVITDGKTAVGGVATPKPGDPKLVAAAGGAAGVSTAGGAAGGGADKKGGDAAAPAASSADGNKKKPLTLVYFIGGVTFAEISALRFLGERESHGRDYLIATTKLINGNTLLESVQETVWNRLKKDTLNKKPPGK